MWNTDNEAKVALVQRRTLQPDYPRCTPMQAQPPPKREAMSTAAPMALAFFPLTVILDYEES